MAKKKSANKAGAVSRPKAKGSHCTCCGTSFPPKLGWPRTCQKCGQTSYRNPLPVAVSLVPVGEGLLVVRRAIPPHEGALALPGGFIDFGESWQEACVREVEEETGLSLELEHVSLFDVRSAEDGTLLVFGRFAALPEDVLSDFTPCEEVSECLVLESPQTLAFALHTEMLARFFAQ